MLKKIECTPNPPTPGPLPYTKTEAALKHSFEGKTSSSGFGQLRDTVFGRPRLQGSSGLGVWGLEFRFMGFGFKIES